MVKILRKVIYIGAWCALVSFQGCTKKTQTIPEPAIEDVLPETAVKIYKLDEESKAFLQNKKVAVILGYGYNDEESVSLINKMIDVNYGLWSEETDGTVKMFIYPDDFQVSGRTRISLLGDLLQDIDLKGIVVIGAPDGFCNAVAKIQDKREDGQLGYPLFNLLPQDDILGSESTSDIVLDYSHKNSSNQEEQTEVTLNFDAQLLIDNSIEQIIMLKSDIKQGSSLLHLVQDIAGKDHSVSYYTDSETGLRSVNHFVFE